MSTVFTGVFLCYFMFSNRASFCTAVSERLNRKCSKGSGPNPASLLSIQTLWSGSVSSFYCLWNKQRMMFLTLQQGNDLLAVLHHQTFWGVSPNSIILLLNLSVTAGHSQFSNLNWRVIFSTNVSLPFWLPSPPTPTPTVKWPWDCEKYYRNSSSSSGDGVCF